MTELYPFNQGNIGLPDSFQLPYAEFGNPDGIPVIHLHGGPGVGFKPADAEQFDLAKWRVILFDQRGAGQAQPSGEVANNTTAHLLRDIEVLREHLRIRRCVISGGGWGALLALVYAQKHPEHILGVLIRSVFLGMPREINWVFEQGANALFPNAFQEFIEPVSDSPFGKNIEAYARRLFSQNEQVQLAAARPWVNYMIRLHQFEPDFSASARAAQADWALAVARISAHYFTHQCFLEPNQILNNCHRLSRIPGFIVQGRYDMICPPESAWNLAQLWPGCQLELVAEGGASVSEPAMAAAWQGAAEKLASKLTA